MARLLQGLPVSLIRLPAGLTSAAGLWPPEARTVAVLDACMPLASTGALAADIVEECRASRALAVVEEMTEAVAFPLLRIGVKAILTYVDARRQLRAAIEAVDRGAVWVPRHVLSAFHDGLLARRTPRSVPHGVGLSRRERQVLGTVLENLSNEEIADRLNISERTVKFHVSNLLSKFAVQRRADLILLSLQSESRVQQPSFAH